MVVLSAQVADTPVDRTPSACDLLRPLYRGKELYRKRVPLY